MTDPLATRKARRAWRRAFPALLLALAASVAAPGALADGGIPVAAQLRLRELAQLAERSNPQARSLLLEQAPVFTGSAPYAVQVDYLRLLRRIHSDAGELSEAYALDERIIRLAGKEHDALQVALASLGRVHKRLNDNDPAATMALLESLNAKYRSLGNNEFEANAQVAYGAIYNTTGQHDRALGHYLRALELVQRFPDLWSPREADLRLALARLFVNSVEAVKALESTRTYRQGHQAMTPRVEALMYFMDGRAHVSLDQLPQAHAAFNRGLALARRHELRWIEANVLGNISDAWLRGHNYVEA